SVDAENGRTLPVHAEDDPVWLDLFPGVPAWTPDGRLVRIGDEAGVRVLTIGGKVATTGSTHVRGVLGVDDDGVVFLASAGEGAAGEGRPPVSEKVSAEGVLDAVRLYRAVPGRTGEEWVARPLAPDTPEGAAVGAVTGGRVAVLTR